MTEKEQMTVEFYDDAIGIFGEDGTELLYWHEQEWIEDPSVVFSIANAIKLAYTNPDRIKEVAATG